MDVVRDRIDWKNMFIFFPDIQSRCVAVIVIVYAQQAMNYCEWIRAKHHVNGTTYIWTDWSIEEKLSYSMTKSEHEREGKKMCVDIERVNERKDSIHRGIRNGWQK